MIVEIPMKQGDVAMVEAIMGTSSSTTHTGKLLNVIFFFLASIAGLVAGYFFFIWRMAMNDQKEARQSLDMSSRGSPPSPPWDIFSGFDEFYESAMSLDIEPEDPEVERAISVGLGLGNDMDDYEEHPLPQII